MYLARLWLTDFRSHADLELELDPAVTVLRGANGAGKTNVLEAIGYLSTQRSFRGASSEVLIRTGAERAVVRGDVRVGTRELLIEMEIPRRGRGRAQVNRQPVRQSRELLEVFRTSVFAPDDLELVKGGPAERRRFLDELLVARRPALDGLRVDLDRVLRQRNMLLKQARGRRSDDIDLTLDVWNEKLVRISESLVSERLAVLEILGPELTTAYGGLAGTDTVVTIDYESDWSVGELANRLDELRDEELRRGVTLCGPHRDDLLIRIDGLASRAQASQGEQRSLALSLRLAAHRLVTEVHGEPPLLMLDDVFSELDPGRADALVANLPPGQVLMTTAGAIPDRIEIGQLVSIGPEPSPVVS